MALNWAAVETLIRNLIPGSNSTNLTQATILERFNSYYRCYFVTTDRALQWIEDGSKGPSGTTVAMNMAANANDFDVTGEYEIYDFVHLRAGLGGALYGDATLPAKYSVGPNVLQRVSWEEMREMSLIASRSIPGQVASTSISTYVNFSAPPRFYCALMKWGASAGTVRRWCITIFPNSDNKIYRFAAWCRFFPKPIHQTDWDSFELEDAEVEQIARITAASLLTAATRDRVQGLYQSILEGVPESMQASIKSVGYELNEAQGRKVVI